MILLLQLADYNFLVLRIDAKVVDFRIILMCLHLAL